MLFPLVWIVLLGAMVWGLVRLAQSGSDRKDDARSAGDPAERESALDVLDRRYASGDIDDATYERMRHRIAGRDRLEAGNSAGWAVSSSHRLRCGEWSRRQARISKVTWSHE